MKAYIISLPDSDSRRKHVLSQLSPYKAVLEIEVIDAFDGRNLTNDELSRIINQDKAKSIYGRSIIGPEIGCTLSHRRCLDAIIEKNDGAALILEDDLTMPPCKVNELNIYHQFVMNNSKPTLLLLSGDYWYTTVKSINSGVRYANVREAVCSHAYICNQLAAKIIASNPSHYLADDWFSIKKMGVKVLAAYPHIADQNRRDLKTEISESYTGFIRRNLKYSAKLMSYYRAVVKRILLYIGHFESKSFVQ